MERGLRTRMHWIRWIRSNVDTCTPGITYLVDTLFNFGLLRCKSQNFSKFLFEADTVILLYRKHCSSSKLLFYLKKIPAE